MKVLFAKAKSIPTPDVVRAFFPDVELRSLGNKKEKALCPLHSEHDASFTVWRSSWRCFGCGARGSNIDLLLKAGLATSPLEAAKMIAEKFSIEVEEKRQRQRKPLTIAQYAGYLNIPSDFLAETFHLEETPKGIAIPYKDENGNRVGVQMRHRLEKGKSKDGRFSWKEGKPYVCGAWAIPRWKEKDTKQLILVEGASDVQVLWFNQISALGVPGANCFKSEWASLLLSFLELVILQGPGQSGTKFVDSIAHALKEANYQGQVKAVSLPEKDPRDLWLRYGEGFKGEFEAAVARASVIDLYPPVPRTADLILKVASLLKAHIFFKEKRLPLLIGLWILGSYIYDLFTFYGYLWLNSPVPRCGKSILGEILSQVCCKAISRLSNITEATLFRLADAGHTLILDELDYLRNQDKQKHGAVMSILNSGFQADGKVPRTEQVKGEWVVKFYDAFAPKVLAGINRLADTVSDRCFKVSMVRKKKDEKVNRFNLRRQRKDLAALRSEIQIWAETRRGDIEAVYEGTEEVEQLSSLDDRFKDISEPLVAIASYADAEAANGLKRILPVLVSLLKDMAGKRAEEEARQEAIVAFIQVAEEVLNQEQKVFVLSENLLAKVRDVEALSWVGSAKALTTFLGKFDLTPQKDQKGEKRGYWITWEWVTEMKNRYSPSLSEFEVSEASETQYRSHFEGDFGSVRQPPF